MTVEELEGEIHALGDELTKVIDAARERWREEYGGIGAFPPIETGALARAFVVSLVEAYRRVRGTRPTFSRLASTITELPVVLLSEAASQYGLPLVTVGVDQLATMLRGSRPVPEA